MSECTRVIVLAAGKSLQLDGVNKVLIKHPADGRTIMDYILDAFEGKKVTVVVGFNAIQIMQEYPQLDYVINPNWALTNNAMSLALALDDSPCYVVPGDVFINNKLVIRLDVAGENLALTKMSENRVPSSIHCITTSEDNIAELYQGPVRSNNHPETTGVFKLSDVTALRAWKKACTQQGNLFSGQVLPLKHVPIKSVDIGNDPMWEINTPVDYINLIHDVQV